MDVVKIGNVYYFLFIAIAIVYFLTIVLTLRRVSKKTAYIVLTVLIFLNFALHFIKQAFVPYINNFPLSLRRSTVENICASSTVFFPLIFLNKRQTILHDYMFFIGMCGGLAALIFPTEAIGNSPVAFDTLRFYICHINLISIPLAAAVLGIFRPRRSSFWAIPIMFLAFEAIICVNEFFLIDVGFVDASFADLFNPVFRNSSCPFGLRPELEPISFLFDPLIPKLFRTDCFGINNGHPFYFPVLWMLFPAIVYLIPIYGVLACPIWLTEHFKSYRKFVFNPLPRYKGEALCKL